MTSKWFLRIATLIGVAGMGLGLAMAASGDHSLSPVHAHLNLIGWVGLFLAGLFYAAHPAAEGRLARAHFGLAVVGVATLTPGIAGSHLGTDWGPAVAGIGSVLTIAAMGLFAAIVFRTTAGERRPETEAEVRAIDAVAAG